MTLSEAQNLVESTATTLLVEITFAVPRRADIEGISRALIAYRNALLQRESLK